MEEGELDHICDLVLKGKETSEMYFATFLHLMYRCGACDQEFFTICKLHDHLQHHSAGGSYHYDHVCRTAVPKFDTCCAYTQTELIKDESSNHTESCDTTDIETDVFRLSKSTANTRVKKARGRPKGSKNIFSKRAKLLKATAVGEKNNSNKLENGFKRNSIVETDEIKHENEIKNNDYGEDTDIECDFIEEGNENDAASKNFLYDTENDVKGAQFDSAKTLSLEQNEKLHNQEHEEKTAVSHETNDSKEISVVIKSEPVCRKDSEYIFDNLPAETRITRNRRKMIQPRKVLKQDGKNKFKKKSLLKSHTRGQKKHQQHIKQVQIKQSFTQIESKTKDEKTVKNNKEDEQTSNAKSEQTTDSKYQPAKSKHFKCGICSMTMSRYKIMRHNCEKDELKEKDGGRKPKMINCEFCGFPFHRSEYVAHLRTHTGERPFICEKCGKDFARIKYLKKHLITHEEIKPFICNICGAGFCQNKEYKQHMCTHTGHREHVCNVCDATFICKASLLTHVQNIHLGETRFECDVCLRRFFKRSSLNLHRATHFAAALNCRYCSKKFKDSTGLKRHEKIHTGVKNFKCHLCEHAFVQSTPFWAHMEKRHALSKDEARKVHRENVQKAKLLKHELINQEAKSVSDKKPIPILQQPLSYETSAALAAHDYDLKSKDTTSTTDIDHQSLTELNHHSLVDINHQVSSAAPDGVTFVATVNYSQALDVSKYANVSEPVHYDDKNEFSDYTCMDDGIASDAMHKDVPEADALPTSSQFENVQEQDKTHAYNVEMFEKVASDFRDYSRYQYDVTKRDAQFAGLYDPLNYEKAHDLSNPEQKVTKLEDSRYEESGGKERNVTPEEPYSGFVKVPDPSLYSKKYVHFEKLPEVTQAHNINVQELDQYRQLDKNSDVHGLKMSDLLPLDKPQDLSFIGIAYQNYLSTAQGQGYLDRLMVQSHYEKALGHGEVEKATTQGSYNSLPVRFLQSVDQGQVEMARGQSPYENTVQDQSNVSM